MSKVSANEIERIAQLARLSVTEEEKQDFSRQLSSILAYFEQLSEVPTEGIEPLVTPTDLVSVWRVDEAQPGMGAAAAVEQAPEKIGHLFKVPPVVGG